MRAIQIVGNQEGSETSATKTEATGNAGKRGARSVARYLPAVGRILLGFVFFACGLMGLLNVQPQPATPLPEGAVAFGLALMKTGYLFPLIKGTEFVVGVLLLANRFVPLALVLIAPVIVNIVAFHAFLSPSGMSLSLVVLALELYLAWSYRKSYRPLLVGRAAPTLT